MKKGTKEMDMLNGSLWNKILEFALPAAATAILEQLFNASDVAVVGHFTGAASTVSVAAVGANSPVIGLIVNLFIGIALGANVVIAMAIGKGDLEKVRRAVHTAILMAVGGGILAAVFGEGIAAGLMRMLNVPEDVYPFALLYLRIYLLGLPVIFLYNFEAAVFRSIGETKIPLAALAFSGVLNLFLNLFFVIKLHMTVNGVATATVISNAVSSIILLYCLSVTDSAVKVEFRFLKFDPESMVNILKIGLPAGVQSAVFAFANIVIQSAINSLGTVIIAASSAAYNIEIMAHYMIVAFSQAGTTFVGQNYGAGKVDRCKRVLGLCLVEDIAATGSFMLLILFFGHNILALFNSDPEVIALGYTRMTLIFFAYLFNMVYEGMSGYLRGFGISLIPAVLTLTGICGVRLLWVGLAFPRFHTFQSLLLAYPLSQSTTALLLVTAVLICRPAKKAKKQKQI